MLLKLKYIFKNNAQKTTRRSFLSINFVLKKSFSLVIFYRYIHAHTHRERERERRKGGKEAEREETKLTFILKIKYLFQITSGNLKRGSRGIISKKVCKTLVCKDLNNSWSEINKKNKWKWRLAPFVILEQVSMCKHTAYLTLFFKLLTIPNSIC